MCLGAGDAELQEHLGVFCGVYTGHGRYGGRCCSSWRAVLGITGATSRVFVRGRAEERAEFGGSEKV